MERPMNLKSFFFFVFFIFFFLCRMVAGDFNVVNFGAKSGGQTDSSKALLSAWAAACASYVPASIYVPPGKYLVNPSKFQGPCKNAGISIWIDGTLVAPASYGSAQEWLLFDGVSGVSVHGAYLDGRGSALWACKAAGSGSCPAGATTLQFNNAKDIVISGLTSVNSELFHVVIDGCKNVTVQGVTINAPGNSPNTDGIHVQQSMDVRIFSTGIKTGDDCISIGPGTQNLWIEGIACGPGHGISIGSLGKGSQEAGVQNVTVKTVTFSGTENGLRIKTWARQSNGFVNGVVFEHVIMQNVHNPIIIDQHYCPDDTGCPKQNSGVKISQVTYRNIQGTSATQVAMDFACSSSSPCRGIELQDIDLTYLNHPAKSSCQNAAGTATGLVVPPSCL